MSVIVYQFQTVKFIQMMSLTFGLFTQVSGLGPLGPLVWTFDSTNFDGVITHADLNFANHNPSLQLLLHLSSDSFEII